MYLKAPKGQRIYIDHEFIEQGLAQDFRVFIGTKGRFKRAPFKLKTHSRDTLILEGAKGKGSLTFKTHSRGWLTLNEPVWAVKGRQRPLVYLPLSDAYQAIYTKRGPYAKTSLKTPCDP